MVARVVEFAAQRIADLAELFVLPADEDVAVVAAGVVFDRVLKRGEAMRKGKIGKPRSSTYLGTVLVITITVMVDRQTQVAGQWLNGLVGPIARAVRLVVLGDDEANVVARRCAKHVTQALRSLYTLRAEAGCGKVY